jgi:hypothetical protein
VPAAGASTTPAASLSTPVRPLSVHGASCRRQARAEWRWRWQAGAARRRGQGLEACRSGPQERRRWRCKRSSEKAESAIKPRRKSRVRRQASLPPVMGVPSSAVVVLPCVAVAARRDACEYAPGRLHSTTWTWKRINVRCDDISGAKHQNTPEILRVLNRPRAGTEQRVAQLACPADADSGTRVEQHRSRKYS